MSNLIGSDQTAISVDLGGGGGTGACMVWQQFTALSSGTLVNLHVDISAGSNAIGVSIILAIYDNSTPPNLLGYTSQITGVAGPQSATLISNISITSGTIYNLAIYADTYYPQINASSSTAYNFKNSNAYTFPTVPSTLTQVSGQSGTGQLALWGTAVFPISWVTM